MAASLMLPPSLRPNKQDHSNLESRLRQIDQEKGAFRHVTEQSLLAGIEQDDAGVKDIQLPDDSDEDLEEMRESHQEMVWKAREEMLRQLDRAKNDTLHALDFVSLLLSKHSTISRTSISPFLQQTVPTGTLEARVVDHVDPLLSSQRKFDAVSRGWKTKSFTSAAEKLLNAGARLETEAATESSFWEQVAHVKSEGWAVSRLPRDSRVIGVHFGCSEAALRFRNRGFAILRRGDDGKLQLDQTSGRAFRNSHVKVTMLRNGVEVAQSSPGTTTFSRENGISGQILAARTGLFEEELFYEACREGRSIASQGVSVSVKTIKVVVDDDCQLLLELVDSHDTNQTLVSNDGDQARTDFVGWALRILLTYAHTQNLLRRSKAPPPIGLQPKNMPEYALLRPLLSHLRHESTLTTLQSWISKIKRTFEAAGLGFSATIQVIPTSLGDKNHSNNADLLTQLLQPPQVNLDIKLPTRRILHLTIHTHLAPPSYGTEYSLSSLSYESMNLNAPRMSSLSELQSFLNHVLTIDLVALIAALPTKSESSTYPMTWAISDNHSGEVFLEASGREVALLSARVQHCKIGLRIQDSRCPNGYKKVTFTWESDKFSRLPADSRVEVQQGQSFMEIVRSLLVEEKS